MFLYLHFSQRLSRTRKSKASLRGRPLNHAAKRGEGLDGVLRIVIVPWHVVETQKCEHRVAVLLQALDNPSRGFTRIESIAEALVESVDKDSVLS